MGALCDPKSRDNTIVVTRSAVEAFVALRRDVHFGDGGLANTAAEYEFWKRQVLRRGRVAARFNGRHRGDTTMLVSMLRKRWKCCEVGAKIARVIGSRRKQ